MNPTTSTVIHDRCASCGAARVGRYCPQCGERFLEAQELRFGHFFRRHVVHELLEMDGPALRALKALFTQPGAAARDFIEGRRQRFSSPLRLYVVVYLLFALMEAIFFPSSLTLPEQARLIDRSGVVGRLIASRSGVDWSSDALRAQLTERLHWVGELGTFLVFVGVAALQALLFFRLRRTYVEHLALSVSVCAWFLAALFIGDVVMLLSWHHPGYVAHAVVQSWIALVGLPVYWTLSVRRFYGMGWWSAAGSGVAMAVGTMLIGTLLNMLVLALLALTA